MTLTKHSDAYNQGYQGYKRNLPRHANQGQNRFDVVEWDLGWEAAKIDSNCDLEGNSSDRLSDLMHS